ncbi:MaoC family dehydratase N-terminal domain-containing protein [Bosea sp. ASV33]|uniref:FAS1-like dehydratase domain-containing protein n=1 Tax=Bosea sp. ASV33 TaxID=2795106 RepID=UPI0018EAFCE7|nr:MaoC family dehydratase N-terminal domain-containing protein [Bosea sp. ASV33]
MADAIDIAHLQSWVGRNQSNGETVTSLQAAQLAALFDREAPPRQGDIVPGLWHWANAFPPQRQSLIGPDGHPVRGGFLPPVPLPRRMWAGGDVTFLRPIRVDALLRRNSTIRSVTLKEGGSGPLVFVQVQHEISDREGPAISELQNIVYRDDPAPGQPAPKGKPAPADADHSRPWHPDEVALFRYSAASFNGHRIHYDLPYAREVEGYPGLVVQGPFTATMLFATVAEQVEQPIVSFSYRGMKPLFAGDALTVALKATGEGQYSVWTADSTGEIGMQAEAKVAP